MKVIMLGIQRISCDFHQFCVKKHTKSPIMTDPRKVHRRRILMFVLYARADISGERTYTPPWTPCSHGNGEINKKYVDNFKDNLILLNSIDKTKFQYSEQQSVSLWFKPFFGTLLIKLIQSWFKESQDFLLWFKLVASNSFLFDNSF